MHAIHSSPGCCVIISGINEGSDFAILSCLFPVTCCRFCKQFCHPFSSFVYLIHIWGRSNNRNIISVLNIAESRTSSMQYIIGVLLLSRPTVLRSTIQPWSKQKVILQKLTHGWIFYPIFIRSRGKDEIDFKVLGRFCYDIFWANVVGVI